MFVRIPMQAESVYCIHGFMRSPSSMASIGKALKKEGFNVHLFGYPSRDLTIREHSLLLLEELKKEAMAHPGEKIHFATHSLGGIILRAAINHSECPEEAKIGRAVLLSPPNRGSSFGRSLYHVPLMETYLGSKAGHELLTAENFDHFGSFPSSMKILVISGTCGWNPMIEGKSDGKVGVKEGCLHTLHDHITLFVGHSWMMYAPSTIEEVHAFISQKKSFSSCLQEKEPL